MDAELNSELPRDPFALEAVEEASVGESVPKGSIGMRCRSLVRRMRNAAQTARQEKNAHARGSILKRRGAETAEPIASIEEYCSCPTPLRCRRPIVGRSGAQIVCFHCAYPDMPGRLKIHASTELHDKGTGRAQNPGGRGN
jgi:hypothetical protein